MVRRINEAAQDEPKGATMRAFLRLCAISCVAWFSAAGAAETSMWGKYAGTATEQFYLDSSGNSQTVILSEAEMKGTFGAARLSVLSQFVPDFGLTVCAQGEIPLNMAFARSVATFEDYSQLFVSYDSGWICATPGPAGAASYRGKVNGHVVGGTGHFAGASGDIESDFGGSDLSGLFVVNCPVCAPEVPFPAYGSFAGSLKGTLLLPK